MYRGRSEFLFSLAILATVASACGGPDSSTSPTTSFPTDPYAVVTSDQHKLSIEVRTGPSQPPGRGETDVQLTVRTNPGGELVEGLDIAVTPWMPVMGHGTSVVPMVSGGEPGTYFLRHVSMYMAGVWELRTTFSGSVMDSATPVFEVR